MFGGRLGGNGSSLLSPFTAGHPPGGCEGGGIVRVVVVGECARDGGTTYFRVGRVHVLRPRHRFFEELGGIHSVGRRGCVPRWPNRR